ncbi:replication initiation protein [uncultured Roseobacter sp.]|uniref:replication initiation protein n=1 Tax=uncultured Roseobacter sp. TaxID=114847 RepID=UPI0026296E4B|nr:replication initiation protein [uncultured Roseobacter sp.]
MVSKPTITRTREVRPNAESIVKPGELIDVVEVTPLTLNDRRIYNLLLENAWDAIDKKVEHVISKSELRGSHNSNDRVGESIERLMSAIVRVKTSRNGEPHLERVQLLGGNVESLKRDGLLHYEIPARLRRIIGDSTVFARLKREVMFALTSKYALTLYEIVQKRGNLKYISKERFRLEELRGFLGVPDGKLTSWSNLNLRALQPAIKEVNALSDFEVQIDPIKTGRRITHVELRWWRKDADGVGASARELTFSKVGRKPRTEGTAEVVTGVDLKPRPAAMEKFGAPLMTDTYQTARLRHPGYDIYFVESEWRTWAATKEPAKDPDRAYLAFFASYAKGNPL